MKKSLLFFIFIVFIPYFFLFAQNLKKDVDNIRLGIDLPEQNPNYEQKAFPLSKSSADGGRITWKTGSGTYLDKYICYGDAADPIKFNILIDQDVKTLQNIKLTLSVYDVDEAEGEVDVVYVNGQFVGTLHGANNSWSINTYTIDPSQLIGGTAKNPGINEIMVDLTVSGWCVTVDWGAISADGGEFDILEFIPGENKLVSNKNPDIHFKFSAEIDDKTVSSTTVKLQYRKPGGELADWPCTYQVSKDILTIKPSSQLNDGVKYSILVVGDKDGVKSKDGAQLSNSPSYDFATIPDLTPDGPLANEPGIFPIQVVRNSKQVKDKPAVIRIYTGKWIKWADVDPSSQLEKINVKVTIKDETKNVIAEQVVEALRTDLRDTPDNKKAGTNSINMFVNWPSTLADGNHTIEAILEPVDQTNVPPITFNKTTPISLKTSKTFKVVYQYILAEEWAGGVPQADRDRLEAVMANCKTFFRDNFPITDVEFTKAADVDLAVPLGKYSWPAASKFPGLNANTTKPFRDTVKNILLNLDAWKNKGAGTAFVGLISHNFGKRSQDSGWVNERSYTGVSYTVGNGAKPEDNKLILLRDAANVAGSGANPSTVAHEFGHNYSISTKNHTGTAHTTDVMPTEGFWVTKKLNKSSTEGNSETEKLLSLMSVNIKPETERWVCDYDYNELFDNVINAPALMKTSGSGPHLFISGGYNLSNQFYLSPVWENEYTTTTYPTQGDMTLSLLNSSGSQLASYNFNSYTIMYEDGYTDTVKSFGFFVPSPQGLATVQLKKGTAIIKEIKKSANAPAINITAPTQGTTWTGNRTITWTGTDADQETLLYRVYYSNDTGKTWISLAANYNQTSLNVNTSQLPSGKNCVIRVTATDGTLNYSSKDISFIVDNGLSIGLLSPGNNTTNIPVGTSIEASFNTPVSPSQITNSTFALTQYGAYPTVTITGDLKYLSTSNTVRFTPSQPLKYNTKYSAKFKSGITDLMGNKLSYDYEWFFTTATDNSSLIIVSADPAPSSTDIPPNSIITVKFNKDINSSSLTTSSFKLIDNGTKSNIPGKVSYNSTDKSGTFSPSGSLGKLTNYKVTLTTDIKSTDNKTLAQNYDYYFRTGFDTVSGVRLIGKYTETGIDDNNDKLYDWLAIDVDISIVEAGTYSINGKLADKNNNEIVWAAVNSLTLNQGIQTIRLKFDGKVINTYQIDGPYYLNDLQIYNNTNTDKSDWLSYAYTTKAYKYTEFQTSITPAVISFTPLDGAKEVPANSTVTATFTRDINPSTIDSLSFYIVDRVNKKVKGSITYNSSIKTATFTPSSPFLGDSVYRVAMTTNVKDNAGTKLLKQYNWSFTVVSAPITASGEISEIYSYPNPFPHSSLPQGGMYFTYILGTGGGTIKIRIYSVTGDFIKEIPEKYSTVRKGFNQVYWDGKNEAGKTLANGTYLYILNYIDAAGSEHKNIGKFTVLQTEK